MPVKDDVVLIKLLFLKETSKRLGLGKIFSEVYDIEDFDKMNIYLTSKQREALEMYLFSHRSTSLRARNKALKAFSEVIQRQPLDVFSRLPGAFAPVAVS